MTFPSDHQGIALRCPHAHTRAHTPQTHTRTPEHTHTHSRPSHAWLHGPHGPGESRQAAGNSVDLPGERAGSHTQCRHNSHSHGLCNRANLTDFPRRKTQRREAKSCAVPSQPPGSPAPSQPALGHPAWSRRCPVHQVESWSPDSEPAHIPCVAQRLCRGREGREMRGDRG